MNNLENKVFPDVDERIECLCKLFNIDRSKLPKNIEIKKDSISQIVIKE